jgi:hypothetical protein
MFFISKQLASRLTDLDFPGAWIRQRISSELHHKIAFILFIYFCNFEIVGLGPATQSNSRKYQCDSYTTPENCIYLFNLFIRGLI